MRVPQHLTRQAGGLVANQVGKRYQCTKCNTEMIVTKAGDGALGCCGQPMQQK
ncbi:MAG: desulfoferrodoxin [Chloroflexi bacterium]|nr:desulfoferrodoxin [Chloroflexota bacterium]